MVKMRHCGIEVSDLQQAIKFYKLLGFEVVSKGKINLPFLKNLKWVKLSCKDGILELYKRTPHSFFIGDLHHIAFTTKYIKGIYDMIKTLFPERILTSILDHKEVKLFFCVDLDSNLIEIVEDK